MVANVGKHGKLADGPYGQDEPCRLAGGVAGFDLVGNLAGKGRVERRPVRHHAQRRLCFTLQGRRR